MWFFYSIRWVPFFVEIFSPPISSNPSHFSYAVPRNRFLLSFEPWPGKGFDYDTKLLTKVSYRRFSLIEHTIETCILK